MLVASLCGLAVPFAFAPHGFVFVEVLSFGVMYLMLREHSRALVSMSWFVFGLGMFGYGVWWIQVSVHQFGLPIYAFSVSVTAGLIIIQAAHLALFGYLSQGILANGSRVTALFAIPAAWVLVEFLRSWFASGFPWLLLGYAHTGTWLGGFAPIGGAYLVSYVVMFLAVSAMLTVRSRDVRFALTALVVISAGAWLSSGSWRHVHGDEIRRATLVQGAVPQEIKWHPEIRQPSIDLYRQLSEPHWQSDVIVWPETAIPAYADEVPQVLASLASRANTEATTLLTGLATRDTRLSPNERRRYFNSLVQIGLAGRGSTSNLIAQYDKRHLVPFGEYMPLDAVLRPITDLLSVPMSDFSAGESDQVTISAGDMIFGASICYEDAYAELLRDALPMANVLVNISNDAWFGATIAPHQHLQISQMRALELGRYLLRATNTGISAVINERGQVVAKSEQFKPQALSAEFRLLSGLTPFARMGSLPIFVWCGACIAVAYWRRPKKTEL